MEQKNGEVLLPESEVSHQNLGQVTQAETAGSNSGQSSNQLI